ncbi:MAG: PP2C family protein-serine/threonine phosphatase [Stomatobaculum sp.]
MNLFRTVEQSPADLSIGMYSHIGGRAQQQDYALCHSSSRGTLAVVCDGMGGMEEGGKASELAVKELQRGYLHRKAAESIPDFFRREASEINEKIRALRGRSGKRLNTGTTMVAVVAWENRLYLFSVGDSRIYLLRGTGLHQLNREHNYRAQLREQLKSGAITREQYAAEEKGRKAEALTSYLGIDRLSLIEVNQTPLLLQPGDVAVLCSDGLYRSMSDDQIGALIRDNDIDPDIAAERLCSMALRYGGGAQDNTTVILLQYMPEQG